MRIRPIPLTAMLWLTLPEMPAPASQPTCVPMGMVGFTTDGVAIYNAVDNGGIDAAAHEVQDRCNGHPQRDGQYHYHGPSPCMPNETTPGLVGYALDGFGIYGMGDATTRRILHDEDLMLVTARRVPSSGTANASRCITTC